MPCSTETTLTAAIALLPLALMPWSVARVVNFGLTIAALTVTIYLSTWRLWPGIDRQNTLLISGSALPLARWLEPVRETIGFGQVNLILMMLITADCLAQKPRWPRGLLVGIAAAIKLTPAVFLLYFLLRRDLRRLRCTCHGSRLGVLLSPVSWSHHWVWIVPVLLAMAAETVRTRSPGWLVTTVVTIRHVFRRSAQLPAERRRPRARVEGQ